MGSAELWSGAAWFDEWYAIEAIDGQTVAIAEPRYWQFPVSYLIQGSERALLFDSGSGRRDIRPVVESRTELPVTVTFSHPHFDHVGNHVRFDRVAMFDHPTLRRRVVAGRFRPSFKQHLKLGRPSFAVSEWWAAGQVIDLGDRRLKVLPVPGHSPESMALLDRERGQLFLGDFLYNAELYVEDLNQYLGSSKALLQATKGAETLYGAHGVPRMPYARLEALNELLRKVLCGSIETRPSFQGLVPQRRAEAGELDLRIPYFGIQGLLAPYLFGGLATLALALAAGILGSWLLSIAILVAGAGLVAVAYRRM
jgi:glyoxylase-like metal-dependent hydrolase (beta-lactamase superfamily II)